VLREVAPGWTLEEVQKLTGAKLIAKERVPEISFQGSSIDSARRKK
jgi:acyl CoA:acetate/3-ketoacid CoA transferase beta subunit